MICLAAATQFEMDAFPAFSKEAAIFRLLCGVGPALSGVTLAAWLGRQNPLPSLVINFGIAGAYPGKDLERGVCLLDICLATREILGDTGIYIGEEVTTIGSRLCDTGRIPAPDPFFLDRAGQALAAAGLRAQRGTFITVCGASGTADRAFALARQYGALCENMEGAALALACGAYGVPFLELRTISNMAGETDKEKWLLREACRAAGTATHRVVSSLFQGVNGDRV